PMNHDHSPHKMGTTTHERHEPPTLTTKLQPPTNNHKDAQNNHAHQRRGAPTPTTHKQRLPTMTKNRHDRT
ncbi:hypothetical protein K443DRAFT_113592, partial [Laccaria amethystina LaAM-08-1]